MARLQACRSQDSSPGLHSLQVVKSSSDEWQTLAQNPAVHDDAMREAHIRDLMEMGGNSAEASYEQPVEKIQDTYIPVSNVDGQRIQGKQQTTDIRRDFEGMKDWARLEDVEVGSRQAQQVQSVARPIILSSSQSTGQDNHNFNTRGSNRREQQQQKKKKKEKKHQSQHQQRLADLCQHEELQTPAFQRFQAINDINTKPRIGLDAHASHRASPKMWLARDPLYNNDMPLHQLADGSETCEVPDVAGGGELVDDAESLLIDL